MQYYYIYILLSETDRNKKLSHGVKALCAIIFLYKNVLDREIGEIDNIFWAKKPKKLPVVFTKIEVKTVIKQLSGVKWIMANLLYGAGLRLMECLRLRVQDIDFEYNQIIIRDATKNLQKIITWPTGHQKTA